MKEVTKESTMFNLVEKWRNSGKSQKQFSSENNVKFHAFNYWVQKYHQSKKINQGFASVTLSPETESITAAPKVEIELAGGTTVRIF